MLLTVARILVVLGLIFIILGSLLYLAARVGLPSGRLPGDIRIEGNNVSCIIALGTSLLLSVILTIVLNVIVRLLNR